MLILSFNFVLLTDSIIHAYVFHLQQIPCAISFHFNFVLREESLYKHKTMDLDNKDNTLDFYELIYTYLNFTSFLSVQITSYIHCLHLI